MLDRAGAPAPEQSEFDGFPVISGRDAQQALEWLVGGRGEQPIENSYVATLIPDPDAGDDGEEVVSVFIGVAKVGRLDAAASKRLIAALHEWDDEQVTCDALVVGGWYRSAEDKGDFRVFLDLSPERTLQARTTALATVAAPTPRRVRLPLVLATVVGLGGTAMALAAAHLWINGRPDGSAGMTPAAFIAAPANVTPAAEQTALTDAPPPPAALPARGTQPGPVGAPENPPDNNPPAAAASPAQPSAVATAPASPAVKEPVDLPLRASVAPDAAVPPRTAAPSPASPGPVAPAARAASTSAPPPPPPRASAAAERSRRSLIHAARPRRNGSRPVYRERVWTDVRRARPPMRQRWRDERRADAAPEESTTVGPQRLIDDALRDVFGPPRANERRPDRDWD